LKYRMGVHISFTHHPIGANLADGAGGICHWFETAGSHPGQNGLTAVKDLYE